MFAIEISFFILSVPGKILSLLSGYHEANDGYLAVFLFPSINLVHDQNSHIAYETSTHGFYELYKKS
jgi:hypothetical protein